MDTRPICKNECYTSKKQLENGVLKGYSLEASKTIIYLGINAMKEVPDLYIKNCKSLSETKEH